MSALARILLLQKMISAVANAPNAATGGQNPQHYEARFSAGSLNPCRMLGGTDNSILAGCTTSFCRGPVSISTGLAATLCSALGALGGVFPCSPERLNPPILGH